LNELFVFLKANADVASSVAALAGAFIALAALVVSVIAIFVASRTLQHQQRHDVLSVRPIPMITTADHEECISVSLRNNGVGPMVIKRLYVLAAGIPKTYLREFMPDLPADLLWSTYAGKIEDYSLSAGEHVILLELKGDDTNSSYTSFRSACRQRLGDITVHIEFTDVYGTKFPVFQKPLSWYARHRESQANAEPILPESDA